MATDTRTECPECLRVYFKPGSCPFCLGKGPSPKSPQEILRTVQAMARTRIGCSCPVGGANHVPAHEMPMPNKLELRLRMARGDKETATESQRADGLRAELIWCFIWGASDRGRWVNATTRGESPNHIFSPHHDMRERMRELEIDEELRCLGIQPSHNRGTR